MRNIDRIDMSYKSIEQILHELPKIAVSSLWQVNNGMVQKIKGVHGRGPFTQTLSRRLTRQRPEHGQRGCIGSIVPASCSAGR